jgi:predicted nucleic acid-binding protein
MTLADLPLGSVVLIDANILIFSRRRASAECETFLSRCMNREFTAVLSTIVVAEFCHRQMIYDAQQTGTVGSNPAKRLAERPEVVKQLGRYSSEVEQLLASGLPIVSVDYGDFAVGLRFQKSFGLLTNDSLLLALAARSGIRAIATADSNFDKVSGFDIYKPSDV